MQLTIKPYLIILATVIGLFVALACFRHFGFEKQISGWGKRNELFMKSMLLAAFLVFGAALVPVCIKLFLTIQVRMGNGELALVKLLRQHAMSVIYAVWIIFGLGFAIALPVMIRHEYTSTTNK